VAPGYSATPWVGQATKVVTTVYDAPGFVALWPPALRLEASTDGETWTSWSGPTLHSTSGGGVYGATVTVASDTPVYFRFAWADSEFVFGDVSEPVLIEPVVDMSSWSTPIVKGIAGGAEPYPGWHVSIQSTLLDADGAPDMDTPAILQASPDGVDYTDVPGQVGISAEGTRSASPQVFERTFYRFRAAKPGPPGWHVSPAVVVSTKTQLNIAASPASVRFPKPFILSGYLYNGHLGDPCGVEVQKPGSRRWSYSSARLAHKVMYAQGPAAWWYRYTPKLRGTYRFRVRYPGGVSGLACVSGTVQVRVR
jgi:hypothetical protein